MENQNFRRFFTGGTTATDVKLHVITDPAQTYFIQADGQLLLLQVLVLYTNTMLLVAEQVVSKTGQSLHMLLILQRLVLQQHRLE